MKNDDVRERKDAKEVSAVFTFSSEIYKNVINTISLSFTNNTYFTLVSAKMLPMSVSFGDRFSVNYTIG